MIDFGGSWEDGQEGKQRRQAHMTSADMAWDIGTLGHWEDIIGTLGHYWDMGHWTVEDIGTLGHGTLDILKYTLPCHTTHTTHTHHTPHTHAHVQPSNTCPQPQPTPLPYGVCWRLALLSLQCVRTAPPPSGLCGV